MPLLVDAYLGDTTHLTAEQHGAYLLLLMSMWKRDGALPNDDGQLAVISRLSPAKWRTSKATLMGFFTVDGGVLTQKRLLVELERSKKNLSKRSEAGKTGAQKRWQTNGEGNGKEDGNRNGNRIENDAESDAISIANRWQNDGPTSTESTPEEIPDSTSVPSAGGTDYGTLSKAIRQAGIGDASPGHLRFRALVDAGADLDEFLAFVPQALKADKPFAYLLGAVWGERERATQSKGQLHQGAMPKAPITVESDAAQRTDQYLREQFKPLTAEEKAASDAARKRVMANLGRVT